MMNQKKSKKEPKPYSWYYYRENVSNFSKGLEAYFVVVLASFFWIILFAIIFDRNLAKTIGLLYYLYFSILFLTVYSVITTKTRNANIAYKIMQVIKRFFDVVISTLSFSILLPVITLISIAVKLESSGPAFFRSQRVGQFGKLFYIYKFRTMYYKPSENPITRVGNFLRISSLNELPMLFNVLAGELSLIGPWPRTPENLEETLDKDKKILEVKPGLTGVAQISLDSPQKMIELDLDYIENWSLLLDLKIILKTLLAVFFSDRTKP